MPQKIINRYHFTVEWGGNRTDFLEISGLDMNIDVVSIRDGNSKLDSEQKAPGLLKFSDVTLKRAIVKGDNDFFNWIKTKYFGTVERRNVVIKLLDDQHNPLIIWKLQNCFPSKYIGPVLISNDSQVATETLVLTHEGISIENIK
ncbi:phage tail protein [Chryseobacterium sp. MMS23-Vi53]|uniref:phage tail protein n=1 Tax=Chryseobacterium sp. MMS23-Vi53 TaxID=3386644 RepID=UPI0039EBAAD1